MLLSFYLSRGATCIPLLSYREATPLRVTRRPFLGAWPRLNSGVAFPLWLCFLKVLFFAKGGPLFSFSARSWLEAAGQHSIQNQRVATAAITDPEPHRLIVERLQLSNNFLRVPGVYL